MTTMVLPLALAVTLVGLEHGVWLAIWTLSIQPPGEVTLEPLLTQTKTSFIGAPVEVMVCVATFQPPVRDCIVAELIIKAVLVTH